MCMLPRPTTALGAPVALRLYPASLPMECCPREKTKILPRSERFGLAYYMLARPTPFERCTCLRWTFPSAVEGALKTNHCWHRCSVSYKTKTLSSPQSSAAVGALSSQAILLAQRSSAALLTKAVDAGSWPLHSAPAAGRTAGPCPHQRQMTFVNETV